jgi:ribosomal protein S18 acetylase RimI-like enzyme
LIVLDNPDKSFCDPLREAVLSVRPADWPAGDRSGRTFGIFVCTADQVVKAGSLVYAHPGWAYIELLWVSEKMRGQGFGRLLMKQTEIEARNKGSHSVYLWTQDFEAPGFFEKLGYQKFVTFENFIPGHQRIGFMKRLAA